MLRSDTEFECIHCGEQVGTEYIDGPPRSCPRCAAIDPWRGVQIVRKRNVAVLSALAAVVATGGRRLAVAALALAVYVKHEWDKPRTWGT